MIAQQLHLQHQKAMLQLLQEFDRICKLLNIPYILFAGTLLGAVRHEGFIPWDDDLDVLMMRSDYSRFLAEAPTLLNPDVFYLQKEFSDHWPMFFSKLRLNGTTCIEKFHPKDPNMHTGIYMDIFPCDNACNTALGRLVQYLSARIVIAKSLDTRGYETNSFIKKVFVKLCRILPKKTCWNIVINGPANGKYVHCFLAGSSKFKNNVFLRSDIANLTYAQFEEHTYPIPLAYHTILTQLYGEYMQQPDENARLEKIHAVFVDLNNTGHEYRFYQSDLDVHTRSIR